MTRFSSKSSIDNIRIVAVCAWKLCINHGQRASICLYRSVYPSVRPSVRQSVCPFVCLSGCLSVCQSVSLSVRLSDEHVMGDDGDDEVDDDDGDP